jgi:hypothetical protein
MCRKLIRYIPEFYSLFQGMAHGMSGMMHGMGGMMHGGMGGHSGQHGGMHHHHGGGIPGVTGDKSKLATLRWQMQSMILQMVDGVVKEQNRSRLKFLMMGL